VTGQAGARAPARTVEPKAYADRTAAVITVSDRGAEGQREDRSGSEVAAGLEALGFTIERVVVPDERHRIEAALVAAASRHPLVVTTGGTGLTPRDVTPQATLAVVDYEVPGLAEAMRAEGRRHTPMASLSRAVVGVRGTSLIVNLPGSPKGAVESLEAIVPVLEHALETLAGPFDHQAQAARGDRPNLPATSEAPPSARSRGR
jgi:molybdopterin adenylyltransferase